jgi:hypothetical protein
MLSSSQFDPKATSANFPYCGSEAGFSLFQSAHLSRYDVAGAGIDMRRRNFSPHADRRADEVIE